jgi:hypothetical protein
MPLTQQALHLANYNEALRVTTADEEIDAMLACESTDDQMAWFLCLARKYRKEVNERAYERLRSVKEEKSPVWFGC